MSPIPHKNAVIPKPNVEEAKWHHVTFTDEIIIHLTVTSANHHPSHFTQLYCSASPCAASHSSGDINCLCGKCDCSTVMRECLCV